MPNQPSSPPKPITEWWRPDLVELPRLTLARRFARQLIRGAMKLIVLFAMHSSVRGLENFPKRGPAILVVNHLGDADTVLVSASLPANIEVLAKVESLEHWLVGPVFRAYGMIFVHRGRPDRKALRAALDGLAEGRLLALAPEGRQSLTGGLEEGTEGAAFLAMRSGAPIVPVALTGTENSNIYGHLNKWSRGRVTLTVGKPFFLREHASRQETLREGTRQIMEALASLLPESYRGIYKTNP
jgi:1-acyl-sn-glycerol-3-phosphate acyltransferase